MIGLLGGVLARRAERAASDARAETERMRARQAQDKDQTDGCAFLQGVTFGWLVGTVVWGGVAIMAWLT